MFTTFFHLSKLSLSENISTAIDIMGVMTIISERTEAVVRGRTVKITTGDFGGVGEVLVDLCFSGR